MYYQNMIIFRRIEGFCWSLKTITLLIMGYKFCTTKMSLISNATTKQL